MDFLGLKTLTLIKDALTIIKQRHAIDIDIETIPIDDEETYKLFQKGHTVGIFQYESDGMQKYMKDLKPTVFEDLIAMNALYRPGPLEYIPSFVKRKNGLEAITYDLPEMEEFLKDTYGITVYQEQVMLLSQKLAGFSKGEADVLRKAMGKKQKDVLDKMKGKFVDGATKNGHPADKLEKSGQTGKHSQAMHSINLTLLVMLGSHTKLHISKLTIRQSIWQLCLAII
jgi:DNA polymerase-3 subunit alpha